MLSQESDEAIIKRAVKNAIEQSRFPDYDKRLDFQTETTNEWRCPEGQYEVFVGMPGGDWCSLVTPAGDVSRLWTNYQAVNQIFPATLTTELSFIVGEIGTPGAADTNLGACTSLYYSEANHQGFTITTNFSLRMNTGPGIFIFRRVG